MTHDDPAAKRLVDFCSRLPTFTGEPALAQAEARWVLEQFTQRRQQLQRDLGSHDTPAHEVPGLRCEIGALEAACSVITQLWQRRFGAALING
jgi:HAMP domain-containing protein